MLSELKFTYTGSVCVTMHIEGLPRPGAHDYALKYLANISFYPRFDLMGTPCHQVAA